MGSDIVNILKFYECLCFTSWKGVTAFSDGHEITPKLATLNLVHLRVSAQKSEGLEKLPALSKVPETLYSRSSDLCLQNGGSVV